MDSEAPKILIIQTAHIGDVVLALPVAQRLKNTFPHSEIHFLLRNGNQNLLANHPAIDRVFSFDRDSKIRSMMSLVNAFRNEKYDLCINLQRYFSSGFIASFSKAKKIIGFNKNPLSIFYTNSVDHHINATPDQSHEIKRNLSLLNGIADTSIEKPVLYPSKTDKEHIHQYTRSEFYTIAPASVWNTKQLPEHKWIELINRLTRKGQVYIIGGSTDVSLAEGIIKKSDQPDRIKSLCGTLSFLQSTALIAKAKRTYTNDSAVLHFSSSMNAPVTSFFLSTVPEFGFSGLSDDSEVIEVKNLDCRPCGLHGYTSCPKEHFKCATDIDVGSVSI